MGPGAAAAGEVTCVSHRVVMRARGACLVRRVHCHGLLVDQEVAPCVGHLLNHSENQKIKQSFP